VAAKAHNSSQIHKIARQQKQQQKIRVRIISFFSPAISHTIHRLKGFD